MKILTCINGHYFDTDAYNQCPHCGAMVGDGSVTNAMNIIFGEQASDNSKNKEKKGLFGGKKKKDETISQPYISQTPISTMGTSGVQPIVPGNMERPMPSHEIMARGNASQGDNPTISIWEQEQADTSTISMYDNGNSSVGMNSSVTASREPITGYSPVEPIPVVSQIRPQPQVQQVSQQPQVQPVLQATPQPTNVVPVVTPQKPDDVRTVMFGTDTEPVTGWLVCVKGECYGESFNIVAGRNNIGRGTNMDIAIVGEVSISREKQALIIFEPLKQTFIMQAGESGSLTYVNDELLLSYVQLKPYDKIQMGNAIFVFVPLCGEQFNWNDYANE